MSLELSPENRVYVKLNRLNRLKSPKICLSLTSNDDNKDIKINEFSAINRTESLLNCNSCQVLKRLVCIKDIAITRLNEDRDDLKLKLTQFNNKNIELSQKLKRFETEKQESIKTETNCDYNQLKTKYEDLESVNRHLRQHLNTLRLVFNELHNSSESTSNEVTTNVNVSNSSTSTTTSSTQTMVKTEAKTEEKSTSTDLNTNTESLKMDSDLVHNSRSESLDETLISSFDKWYNK